MNPYYAMMFWSGFVSGLTTRREAQVIDLASHRLTKRRRRRSGATGS